MTISIGRTFDFVMSAGALVLLMLPMALLSVAIWQQMGSPVLFRQKRIGMKGEAFEIVKFRTMLDETDHAGRLLSDEDRLTSLGRFLRAASLDELPELWNILRGEMSFVGPRPLLPEYLPYYTNEQARRHNVRPGLTGVAKVRGRNSQSWDERFSSDLEYVDNRSFWGDLRILALTAWKVLARSGISAEGHETMPRFDDQVRAGLATGIIPEDRAR